MAICAIGTVQVYNGSKTVGGYSADVDWIAAGIFPGCIFTTDGGSTNYEIDYVEGERFIVLKTAYTGSDASDIPYEITYVPKKYIQSITYWPEGFYEGDTVYLYGLPEHGDSVTTYDDTSAQLYLSHTGKRVYVDCSYLPIYSIVTVPVDCDGWAILSIKNPVYYEKQVSLDVYAVPDSFLVDNSGNLFADNDGNILEAG